MQGLVQALCLVLTARQHESWKVLLPASSSRLNSAMLVSQEIAQQHHLVYLTIENASISREECLTDGADPTSAPTEALAQHPQPLVSVCFC
jgi:hypothetical protein